LPVKKERKVSIFFIEIKNYIALNKVSSQMEADDLMRKDSLNSPLVQSKTQLVGLLIMATHFSIYELTTENSQLLPVCIIPDAQLLMDVALKVLWNYNIWIRLEK